MKKYLITLPAVLLAGLVFSHNSQAAADAKQRQLQRLAQLAAHPEKTGNPFRIFIVDGFRDVDVEAFMNSNFDGINNVMFTGVIVTDKHGIPMQDKRTGRVQMEDDGC